MLKRIVLGLILLTFGHFSKAQEFKKEKLDQYLETLEVHNKLMGALVLSHEGEIVYSKSIGFSDLESQKRTDLETRYRVGSITKMFTSSLTFKAIEEGKLTLEQQLDDFYPEVVNASKICISHLLNHNSGIHSFTSDPDYLTYHTKPKSRAEMLELIVSAKSDFEPGSKGQYSNSNYVLLTLILEKIYQKEYGDLLKEKITEPLGLQNTYLGGKTDLENHESFSYKFTGTWEKESETDMSIPLGAGAIVSNTTDLIRFIEALFGGQIISHESLEQMIEIKDNFGRGIFKFPLNEKSSYGHGGGIDGFVSMLSYFPEDKLAFVLATNGSNYDNNKVAIGALSIYFGLPFEIPVFNNVTLTEADLEKYLGVYANPDAPMEITITKKGNTLIGQGTGQPSFPLDPVEKDKFEFNRAGLVLEFIPGDKKMLLKQGGSNIVFTMKDKAEN